MRLLEAFDNIQNIPNMLIKSKVIGVLAKRFYQLPSLTGLNVFDACARHGSFSEAAVELGVTLGAVSRQIKSLETELNCSLFRRHYRGVELTSDGIDLFQTLSSSFQQIGRLCQDIRVRAQGNEVTIAATTAFASLWLMPRLGEFWQQNQDVNLNHAISDNPEDAGYATADLRVRYGKGQWKTSPNTVSDVWIWYLELAMRMM